MFLWLKKVFSENFIFSQKTWLCYYSYLRCLFSDKEYLQHKLQLNPGVAS